MENYQPSKPEVEAINQDLSLDVFDVDDSVLMEAGNEPVKLPFRFVEDASLPKATSTLRTPIQELKPLLILLFENVLKKEIDDADVAVYEAALDPLGRGYFDFYTLLKRAACVAEDAEKQARAAVCIQPDQPVITRNRDLRPRRSLRKPARVIFYEKYGC